MVGGAFALESYTGLVRRTKDLDVFALREDVDGLMRFLAAAGYETEVRFPHWISKAHKGGHVIDIIFGSGNGICAVDQKWFGAAHAGAGSGAGSSSLETDGDQGSSSRKFPARRFWRRAQSSFA